MNRIGTGEMDIIHGTLLCLSLDAVDSANRSKCDIDANHYKFVDTQEEINSCLSCKREDCTDCLHPYDYERKIPEEGSTKRYRRWGVGDWNTFRKLVSDRVPQKEVCKIMHISKSLYYKRYKEI